MFLCMGECLLHVNLGCSGVFCLAYYGYELHLWETGGPARSKYICLGFYGVYFRPKFKP
jgi:hypothetical protein